MRIGIVIGWVVLSVIVPVCVAVASAPFASGVGLFVMQSPVFLQLGLQVVDSSVDGEKVGAWAGRMWGREDVVEDRAVIVSSVCLVLA